VEQPQHPWVTVRPGLQAMQRGSQVVEEADACSSGRTDAPDEEAGTQVGVRGAPEQALGRPRATSSPHEVQAGRPAVAGGRLQVLEK
jgi:hypothetical protein